MITPAEERIKLATETLETALSVIKKLSDDLAEKHPALWKRSLKVIDGVADAIDMLENGY